METQTQLYAELCNYAYKTVSCPIANEEQAVTLCFINMACSFRTYEVVSVEIAGKTLTGERENYSPRRFIGVEAFYTRDEVIALFKQDAAAQNDRAFADIILGCTRHFEKDPADSIYIDEPGGRPGDYLKLSAGEKLFDRQGQLLWPLTPPAPENQASATVPTAPKL